MPTKKETSTPLPPVVLELTGTDAGATTRLAGYEFQNGELHVPHANLATVEKALAGYSVRRKKQPKRKS